MNIKWYDTITEWQQAEQACHDRLKQALNGYKDDTAIYQDYPKIGKDSRFGLEVDDRIQDKCLDLITTEKDGKQETFINVDKSQLYEPVYDDLDKE